MPHDVIVGVDTSETSRRAVEYACGLCERGRSLLLCHVIQWSPFSFTTLEENEHRATRREAELEAANEQILRPLGELAASRGVKVDLLAHHGDPTETLIDLAESEGARLVVIGRTGDSGLHSRIFGTLAGHLVQQCPVPVTVVP